LDYSLNAIDCSRIELVFLGSPNNPTGVTIPRSDILSAAEKYNGPEPVNLGSGYEISIKDLAEMITRLTGFNGKLVWDTSKPNGQPRRGLDVSRAREYFGWEAKTPFEEGMRRTIQWYEETRRA